MAKRCYIYRSQAYPLRETDEALVAKLGSGHTVWKNAKGASIIIMADGCPKRFPRKRVIYRRDLKKHRKYSHAYDIRDAQGNVSGVLKVPYQMRLANGESPKVFGRMHVSEYHLVDENSLKTVPSGERPKGGVVTDLHHSISGHLDRIGGRKEKVPDPKPEPKVEAKAEPEVGKETMVEQDTRTTREQNEFWDEIARDEVLELKGEPADMDRKLDVPAHVLEEFKDSVSEFFLSYNVVVDSDDPDDEAIGDALRHIITGIPEYERSGDSNKHFPILYKIFSACMAMKSHLRMDPGRLPWKTIVSVYRQKKGDFFKYEGYVVSFIRWITRGVRVFNKGIEIDLDFARRRLYYELLHGRNGLESYDSSIELVTRYNFRNGKVELKCEMGENIRNMVHEFVTVARESDMPFDIFDLKDYNFKESPTQMLHVLTSITDDADFFDESFPNMNELSNVMLLIPFTNPEAWTAAHLIETRENLGKYFKAVTAKERAVLFYMGIVRILAIHCQIVEGKYMWVIEKLFQTPSNSLFMQTVTSVLGKIRGKAIPPTLDVQTSSDDAEAFEEMVPESFKEDRESSETNKT